MENKKKKRSNDKKKDNNKLKILNIISVILNIIILIFFIVNTYMILKYDILPLKYLVLYFLIAIVIPILILVLFYYKKSKFKLKISLLVIDFIYVLLFTFATIYLNKTFNFLDEIDIGIKYITKNYKVVVSKDSTYQVIDDLEKKNIGYVEIDNTDYKVALGEINKKITFQNKSYLDSTTMFEAFGLKELDGLVTTDTYYELLSENIEKFKDDYRVIYEFSVKEKEEEDDITKDVDVTKDVFNVYVTGMDTYGDISTISRSDVNIVISINPKTYQILMVNIPRDYYVVFPGQTKKDKLTHAGLYGTNMSIRTIEDILDIDINYYVKTNFNTVISLVDALGGVDVYSMYTFNYGFYYKKGYNHVNGSQALNFARTRYVLPNGDIDRGRNQEAMIQAIITKATSMTILTRYTTLLESLKGTFMTNISTDKITDIIKMQLDKMPKWNITSMTLSGFGDNDYTSVFKDTKVFVMHPDEETIKKAQEALQDVRDGKILESSYEENTGGEVYTPFRPTPSPVTPDSSKPVVPEEEKDEEEDNKENDENSDIKDDDTNNNDENLNDKDVSDGKEDNNVDDENKSPSDSETTNPDNNTQTNPSDTPSTNPDDNNSDTSKPDDNPTITPGDSENNGDASDIVINVTE